MAVCFRAESVLGFGGGLCWPEVSCVTSFSVRGQRYCWNELISQDGMGNLPWLGYFLENVSSPPLKVEW